AISQQVVVGYLREACASLYALLRRCGTHLRCRPGKGVRPTALGPQRAFLRLRTRLFCGFRYIDRDADVDVAGALMAGFLPRRAVRREIAGDLGDVEATQSGDRRKAHTAHEREGILGRRSDPDR